MCGAVFSLQGIRAGGPELTLVSQLPHGPAVRPSDASEGDPDQADQPDHPDQPDAVRAVTMVGLVLQLANESERGTQDDFGGRTMSRAARSTGCRSLSACMDVRMRGPLASWSAIARRKSRRSARGDFGLATTTPRIKHWQPGGHPGDDGKGCLGPRPAAWRPRPPTWSRRPTSPWQP